MLQISACCWSFLIRLIMHGININLHSTIVYLNYSAHSSWIKFTFGWRILKYDSQKGPVLTKVGRNTYRDQTNRRLDKKCISYKTVSILISACGTFIHTQCFTTQRIGTCSFGTGIYCISDLTRNGIVWLRIGFSGEILLTRIWAFKLRKR
jgi:hypothetical protein